ncbi:AMP-binding protein, partial [Bacillus thuringiensis]
HQLQLNPIGVIGEICIAGDGLVQGYLNRPELTKEKFIYHNSMKKRLYRTGDLGRWLPDGNIEYCGRMDQQVKIRGYRVELGEIEARLLNVEEIQDVAVVIKEAVTGEK